MYIRVHNICSFGLLGLRTWNFTYFLVLTFLGHVLVVLNLFNLSGKQKRDLFINRVKSVGNYTRSRGGHRIHKCRKSFVLFLFSFFFFVPYELYNGL